MLPAPRWWQWRKPLSHTHHTHLAVQQNPHLSSTAVQGVLGMQTACSSPTPLQDVPSVNFLGTCQLTTTGQVWWKLLSTPKRTNPGKNLLRNLPTHSVMYTCTFTCKKVAHLLSQVIAPERGTQHHSVIKRRDTPTTVRVWNLHP